MNILLSPWSEHTHTHRNHAPRINRGCMHKRSANKKVPLTGNLFSSFTCSSSLSSSSSSFQFFLAFDRTMQMARNFTGFLAIDLLKVYVVVIVRVYGMLFIEFLNICQSWFGYFCLKPMSIGPILIFVWMNTSAHGGDNWAYSDLFLIFFFSVCIPRVAHSINRKEVRTQVKSIGNKIEWIRLYRL